MRYLIILILTLSLLGLGCRKTTEQINYQDVSITNPQATIPVEERPLATFFRVQPNDQFGVNGLLIEIKRIDSPTTDGCTSPPTGCPDSVEIQITNQASDTQSVILVVLGGTNQNASSERIVFGHRFVLSSVSESGGELGVFIASAGNLP